MENSTVDQNRGMFQVPPVGLSHTAEELDLGQTREVQGSDTTAPTIVPGSEPAPVLGLGMNRCVTLLNGVLQLGQLPTADLQPLPGQRGQRLSGQCTH